MPPLKITLSGNSDITRQPERCVLHVIIKDEQPNWEQVTKKVIETSNEIERFSKEISPKTFSDNAVTVTDTPLEAFSSSNLHTRSYGPVANQTDPTLQQLHSATIKLDLNLQGFTKLNEIVDKLVSYPTVDIKFLDWCLTEATQKALEIEARKEAMRNAVQKVNDYAEVVGRTVVAVAVHDEKNELKSTPAMLYKSAAYTEMERPRQMQIQQQQIPIQMQQEKQRNFQLSRLNADRNASQGPYRNPQDHESSVDLSPQLILCSSSVSVEFEAID